MLPADYMIEKFVRCQGHIYIETDFKKSIKKFNFCKFSRDFTGHHYEPKMTKTESFNYLRTGKLCNGINDFGLLREQCAYEAEKPKGTSTYFPRIVFAIGVVAGITLIVRTYTCKWMMRGE